MEISTSGKGILPMSEPLCRPTFHLLPPQGWLNDPNGSIFYNGSLFIFFQYAPKDPRGGKKSWGQFVSKDLISFQWKGEAIRPDSPFDRDGVFSGTAIEKDGALYLFYTGCVVDPGDHDRILSGFHQNTARVISRDGGRTFGEKKLLFTNADYPKNLSCHVRDPKVAPASGGYCLLLGARTAEHHGALLSYVSEDLKTWSNPQLLMTEDLGYMLECPDTFVLTDHCGRTQRFAAFCPQGAGTGPLKDTKPSSALLQNTYPAGYCPISRPIRPADDEDRAALCSELTLSHFTEWDFGFDFYAPQTFLLPDGRRILIGWAGVPDSSYDNAPAVREGWQHVLTVPREMILRGKKILTRPITELNRLHSERLNSTVQKLPGSAADSLVFDPAAAFDAKLSYEPIPPAGASGKLRELFRLSGKNSTLILSVCADAEKKEGAFALLSIKGKGGCGRTIRRARIDSVSSVRILWDHSIAEIYFNDGEAVMTTYFYPEETPVLSVPDPKSAELYKMSEIIDGHPIIAYN